MSKQQQAGPMDFVNFALRVGAVMAILVLLDAVTPPFAIEMGVNVPRYIIVVAVWFIASAILTENSFSDGLGAILVGAFTYIIVWIAVVAVMVIVGRSAALEWIVLSTAIVGSVINIAWLYTVRRRTVSPFSFGADDTTP